MGRYVIRRMFGAVLVIFIIATFSFFMIRIAPGGPFDGERALLDVSACEVVAVRRGVPARLSRLQHNDVVDRIFGGFGQSEHRTVVGCDHLDLVARAQHRGFGDLPIQFGQ